MKRNLIIILIILAVSLIVAGAILLPRILPSGGSVYSRRVEEDLFSLGIESLNCALSEPFSLKKGDVIEVSAVHISGELSIVIAQDSREPIYQGRNPELGSFQVKVPEDGIYQITVSGKHAKGSVSFRIDRTDG